MEENAQTKIYELLKSGDPELCALAVALFKGLTRHYADYYAIRSRYDPVNIYVTDDAARQSFNEMFEFLDKTTITVYTRRNIAEHRKTTLSGNQKRQLRKKQFKKNKEK
jgi:hypothetical protein